LKAIFPVSLLVLILSTNSGAQQLLSGCSDPRLLASHVRKLQATRWSEISSDKLLRLWPTNLEPVCVDEKSSRTVVSRRRVIDGELQCGEAFNFDVTNDSGGHEREQLHSISFHYTAATRKQVVSMSRALLESFGLPAVDLERAGEKDQQQFQRMDRATDLSTVIDLRFQHRGKMWSLFLSVGQDRIHTE